MTELEELRAKLQASEASAAAMREALNDWATAFDKGEVYAEPDLRINTARALSSDAGTKAMRVIEAAKKFHDFIGDGNNGPPPFYLDAFNEFEDVLLADWEAL